MSDAFDRLINRAEELIGRIEAILPGPLSAPDWGASIAFRYRRRSNGHGVMEPVRQVAPLKLSELKEIDAQREKIVRNTEQFISGLPAKQCLADGVSRHR